MRILMAIDNLRSGGKERRMVELLKGLNRRKNVVVRLLVLSEDIHYTEIKNLGIEIICLVRRYQKDLGMFYRIYQEVKRFKPDIIHSWETMTSVYITPSAAILDFKFINAIIADSPSQIKPFSSLWWRIRLTFPFSNLIIGNSQAGLRAYKAPLKKSKCIHNGVDLSRFNKLEKEEAVRRSLNITTTKVIGMVATFSKYKDYPTFIMAAIKLLASDQDLSFVCVGDGPEFEKIRAMVPPKLASKIIFTGRCQDVESIVNIFSIGVLATFTEGISNSVIEYMALSKPVVATIGGGTSELVIDGVTGFLVPSESIDALERSIQKLLHNPDQARAFGKTGQLRIQRYFNLNRMTHEYFSAYTELLS